MPRHRLERNTDATIRYDAAFKYLRSVFEAYEAEVAKSFVSPRCEEQIKSYQDAYRKVVEALILFAHEVAKLNPQYERPN